MPDFAVNTAFMATNRTTPALKNMSAHIKIFGKTGTAAIMKVNAAMTPLIARTKMYGKLALGIGAALVAKQFVEFDDAIYGATARFKAAEKEGTDMTKVMQNLRDAARETGAQTQFTATLAAKGLDKFALAGFNSEEAIKALRSQVDLATVTGEDFMRVADISSDLLGSFGGAALESSKKIKMLKEMNALLAVGTLSANVTMESLFETLKTAAPVGTALGMSMKDVIATTSVLGSAGIKGTEAATALKNIFLRLAAPTDEVRGAMHKLNLEQKDFVNEHGNLKSTAEIFKIISERTKGMSNVKVAALFKALAGLRGIAGAAVISKNIGQIRKQMEAMGKDPKKAMQETAEFMRKSLGNRIKTLLSALTELGFKFIDAFAGPGADAITELTKSLNKLSGVFTFLGKVFAKVLKLLPYMITLFAAYKVAIWAVTIAQQAQLAIGWIKYLWEMRTLIMAAAARTKIWAAAQWVLNAAMSPMILTIAGIVAGVAALGAAAYMVIKHWEAVKKFFVDLWALISKVFASLSQFSASGLEAELRSSISSPKVSSENNINFEGNLNIAGAPKGSTATGKTRGAPPIKMDLMGAMD